MPLAAAAARAASTAPQDPRPAQRRHVEAEAPTALVAAAAVDDPFVDLTLDVPELESPSFLEDLDLGDIPPCSYMGDPFSPVSPISVD